MDISLLIMEVLLLRSCRFLKFRLSKKEKALYKELKKKESSIIQAYPLFDPSCPEFSPARALYELYKSSDSRVLYSYFLNQRKKAFGDTICNDISIGLTSGIISGAVIALAEIFSNKELILTNIITYSVCCLLLTFLLIAYANLLVHFYVHSPFAEMRINIMYQVLELDKYSSTAVSSTQT